MITWYYSFHSNKLEFDIRRVPRPSDETLEPYSLTRRKNMSRHNFYFKAMREGASAAFASFIPCVIFTVLNISVDGDLQTLWIWISAILPPLVFIVVSVLVYKRLQEIRELGL